MNLNEWINNQSFWSFAIIAGTVIITASLALFWLLYRTVLASSDMAKKVGKGLFWLTITALLSAVIFFIDYVIIS